MGCVGRGDTHRIETAFVDHITVIRETLSFRKALLLAKGRRFIRNDVTEGNDLRFGNVMVGAGIGTSNVSGPDYSDSERFRHCPGLLS